MSKKYGIKDNTIFSVNEDGSVTTIATIDERGEINPNNRPPYRHIEEFLHNAKKETHLLRIKLSEKEDEIKKLQANLQKEIKNKESIESELKQITPISSELIWRKGVKDGLSTIVSYVTPIRGTSYNVKELSKWMKLLMGGIIFLLIVIIAILFFYTGSVKEMNNSSFLGESLIDSISKDTTINTSPYKEVDLTKLPLIIKDVSIGNTEKDGSIISDFGETIYSCDTKYLVPQISYFGIRNEITTLRVKWINPDGSIRKGSTSVGDFSQIDGYRLSVGKNDKIILLGWGKNKKRNWEKGDYVIEIWYEDIMLIRKPFTIY